MKKKKIYCINEKQTIKDAISVIQNNLSRCAIVLNDNEKVIGVFSEGDVLRLILNEVDIHTPLKKVIRPSFIYLNESDARMAYDFFKKYGITLIPVIDNNFMLIEVITIFDVLDHLAFVDKKDK